MPTFNLTPILFPKPKKDDVYDMLKDLLQIKEKQFAIDEGGEINNPASYDPLIAQYEKIVNNPTIDANDRRDAQKIINDLTIKKLKADLDKKKDLDADDLKQSITQDLRELEFEFPGNPISYSTGAMMKYNDLLYGTSEREGLNQLIDILKSNYIDTSSLESYRDESLEELSKYSDIVDAYETGDMTRLSEYAVVYTPYGGKVKAMKIIFRGDTDPSHSQKTNMRFSRDVAGNLVITPDVGEASGMQVYFVRANAQMGDKYQFANSEFKYGVIGWETKDSAAFDYKKIKHAPLHSLPSGSFIKTSNDKLYYVNRDRSFFPVQEQHKEELGFSEDKVYNLSPDEEMNILPGAIDHSTFPIIERYNREASKSDFNYWQAFEKELGPAEVKVAKETLGKIPGAAKSFWKITKEAWQQGMEQAKQNILNLRTLPGRLKEPSQPKQEGAKWGSEELKELPTVKTAQEFVKGLKIK